MPFAPLRDLALPPRTRRILHLDVDAFLASVEQALHPELAGKPVVVGGQPTSRNVVMSASYEARAWGVRSGILLAEARRRCPRAIFRDGDAQAANRLREEATRVLLAFTPRVEVASIDDFFADLTGSLRLLGCAFLAAERMGAEVRARTGLPLSIGIGTNKLVAKLAGKLAKPGGIAEIFPGGEEAFLGTLPIRLLPGVGHSIGAALERFAIHTVGELRLVSREVLFATFGRDGLVLFERARGRDEAAVEATHALDEQGLLRARPPRSIRRETTFEPEEGRRDLVLAMLAYLMERAAERLRAFSLVAGAIEVHVRHVDTRPRIERGGERAQGLSAVKRKKLAHASDATVELVHAAHALFDELPRPRALVKNVGLALHDLVPSMGWQGRLFDAGASTAQEPGARTSRADRQRRLDRALDLLRDKHGFGRVLRGSSTPLGATHALEKDGFRLRTPSLNQ